MAVEHKSTLVYDGSDPCESYEPGLSRTGIELWEEAGKRWIEFCPGSVSPVAVTLEEKAALTVHTGHWPTNDRNWGLLPRWQRAIVR